MFLEDTIFLKEVANCSKEAKQCNDTEYSPNLELCRHSKASKVWPVQEPV